MNTFTTVFVAFTLFANVALAQKDGSCNEDDGQSCTIAMPSTQPGHQLLQVKPIAATTQLENGLEVEGADLMEENDESLLQTNETGSVVSVRLSWETGTVDSGLARPLKPSFSENKNGWTPPKDPQGDYCKNGPTNRNCWPNSMGKTYVGSKLHSLSVQKVSWAKDGDHVLKVFANGWNKGSKGAFRSELSAVQDNYLFHEGDYQYFAMSFWLDDSWDQVGKYSTLIAQWKMSPGHPHAAVRLSNEGDYKLYFKGDKLWRHTEELDTKHGGSFLGVAKRKSWNDIKIFFKKSRKSDGFAKVWLNGELAFEHEGTTLLKSGRGYTKFGMYTNIEGERTIYFDEVSFCHSADREACLGGQTVEQWIANGGPSPSPKKSDPQPSPPPPSPVPGRRPTPNVLDPTNAESWKVTPDMTAKCTSVSKILPASIAECRTSCSQDGMNAFNVRYKEETLRACYCLSCSDPDGRLMEKPAVEGERWEAHVLLRDGKAPPSPPPPPPSGGSPPSPPLPPPPSPVPEAPTTQPTQPTVQPNPKPTCPTCPPTGATSTTGSSPGKDVDDTTATSTTTRCPGKEIADLERNMLKKEVRIVNDELKILSDKLDKASK